MCWGEEGSVYLGPQAFPWGSPLGLSWNTCVLGHDVVVL